jgi:hypothetical protein
MTLKGLINNSNYRTLIMQLLNKTVSTFSDANCVIAQLNRCINTTYIPIGDNVTEVVVSFNKIQLSRSFNPYMAMRADLSLTFNEGVMMISYTSTSGTSVLVEYKFDDSMQVKEIEVSVWIPDDRAMSGRCHYECLTEALYPNWDKVQSELIEMNPNVVLPQPEWSKLSNVDNEPRESRRFKVRSKVDEVIEDYEYENEIEVDYDNEE